MVIKIIGDSREFAEFIKELRTPQIEEVSGKITPEQLRQIETEMVAAVQSQCDK